MERDDHAKLESAEALTMAADVSAGGEPVTVTDQRLREPLLPAGGILIPGYTLLDKIDSGGQATVYRARQVASELTVAVKILNGGIHADANARERFCREIATLRALDHPNIVCVIESGRTPTGLDFLVMNYVDGRRLDALWRDSKSVPAIAPEPAARLQFFKRLCDVMQAAHLKGITHRDLSPSNILITVDGEPHVLDFGLASTAFNDLFSPTGREVSVTGQFIGKLQYAAPEQARGGGDAVDIRTDVYALGVILYQILTNGAFPYEVVGNLADVLNNIIHIRPQRPSELLTARGEARQAGRPLRPLRQNPAAVDETIEAVVLKALEKDPNHRYQSAGALAADVQHYLAGRPTSAIPHGSGEAAGAGSGIRSRARWVVMGCAAVGACFGVAVVVRSLVGSTEGRSAAATPAAATSPVPQVPGATTTGPAQPAGMASTWATTRPDPAEILGGNRAWVDMLSVGNGSEWLPHETARFAKTPTINFQPDASLVFKGGYRFGSVFTNGRVRMRVVEITERAVFINIRSSDDGMYTAWCNLNTQDFGIGLAKVNAPWKSLIGLHLPPHKLPFIMTFSAEGRELILTVDGKEICRAKDSALDRGKAGVSGGGHVADVRVRVLD